MPKTRHQPNTVGSRIVTAFLVVKIGEKIKDVERVLLDKADAFDTIDYVYVVDNKGLLNGVVSIRELHASSKEAKVEDVMKTRALPD